MTNADEEESTDGYGDLGEGVLSPTVRGKGDADRHKDCFMFRFHKNELYFDCLIPDFELINMFSKRANDRFFTELKSVSVTPVAKRGLGKHFTFDFLAPCFEEHQKHKRYDNLHKKPSFYGEVKFDYKQFGED